MRSIDDARASIVIACLIVFATMAAFIGNAADDDGPRLTGTRIGGILTGDNVWNQTENPYWMESSVFVPQGSSLTIEPGVTVFVNGAHSLISEGDLFISGTPADRVVFSPNGSVPEWEGIQVIGGRLHATGLTIIAARLWVTNTSNAFLDRVEIQGQAYWSTLALFDVVNPTIGNVTITHTGDGNAIQVDNATNLILRGFDLSGGGSAGFNADKCLRCTIAEGTIESFVTDGLALIGDNCLVSGVTISGSDRGISYVGNESVIERNSLLGTNLGIQVFYSNNTVANNTILDPGIWGITVNGDYYPAMGNLVVGNKISGAGYEGITLDCFPFHPTYCDHNILAYNTIEDRNMGLRILTSNHDIHGNVILGNAIGANIEGSNNRIYHNHFTSNTQQALDPGVSNRWDDGYPSGGNWWSDYAGSDLFRGPLQNLPGSDGIGDSPYGIDADSKDNYPFYYVPVPPPPKHVTARTDGFSGNIVVEWEPPPFFSIGQYLIYTAPTPTGFDFTAPNATVGSLATTWNDAGAASWPGPRYYVVRALNSSSGMKSSTSNTAGKWTTLLFPGVQTFSTPFAPYPWVDYSQAGWVDTIEDFLIATGAASVAYMEGGTWIYVPGIGDLDHRLSLGEGFLIRMTASMTHTFVGLPASMISYEESPPFWYEGFGQENARRIWASPSDNDVHVSWVQPPGMMPMTCSYKVYYSSTRDGFFGVEGLDFFLLNGAPVVAPWGSVANAYHVGALSSGQEWYYIVVPYVNSSLQGSSSYSVGVQGLILNAGYSAVSLPLRPYMNGSYLNLAVSSISSPELLGVQWLDLSKGDWVAHATWMLRGMHDTSLTMVMAVQISATTPTKVIFSGV